MPADPVTSAPGGTAPPVPRSHYLPRTGRGWVAVVLFFLLLLLAEPPVTHTLANRVEPWLLGVPFLYGYLLVVYTLLIGVLLWALRSRL